MPSSQVGLDDALLYIAQLRFAKPVDSGCGELVEFRRYELVSFGIIGPEFVYRRQIEYGRLGCAFHRSQENDALEVSLQLLVLARVEGPVGLPVARRPPRTANRHAQHGQVFDGR